MYVTMYVTMHMYTKSYVYEGIRILYALCICIVCMHCVYALCICMRMPYAVRKEESSSTQRPRWASSSSPGARYDCIQVACVCHVTHLDTCTCTCVWLPECSEQVIGPLVQDKSDVAWVAWLKHVEFYKLAHAHEISVVDVLTLDNLIFEAQEAFRLVRKK